MTESGASYEKALQQSNEHSVMSNRKYVCQGRPVGEMEIAPSVFVLVFQCGNNLEHPVTLNECDRCNVGRAQVVQSQTPHCIK